MIKKLKKILKSKFGKEQINQFAHSKNYVLASYIKQALSIVSTPIITRYLSLDQYGILSIISTVTQIFTVILMLNFNGAITRRYYEKEPGYPGFLSSTTSFLIVYNIAFVLVLNYFKVQLASFFNIYPNLFILGIFFSIINLYTAIYLSHLQAAQKSRKRATITIINAVLAQGLSLAFVVLFKENKHLGRLYGQMIVNGIFMIYSIFKLYKFGGMKFGINNVKYAITYGMPLIPHSLSTFILTAFDRIIINQIKGQEAAGVYSFAYTVGMLMSLFVSSINKAWTPSFFMNYSDKKYKLINKLATSNTKIIFIGALGLILFSEEIVAIFADVRYHEAISIVPVIIISYIAVYFYSLYANYSFYKKKTVLISINTLLAGVLNIILNYYYIPKYGYVAAAYTTLISYFVLFILHFINAKFIIKEKILSLRFAILPMIIFSLSFTLFIFIKKCDINYIFTLLFKICLLMVNLLVNFKFIIPEKK